MIDRPKAIIDLIAEILKSQKSFENELLNSISSKNKNIQANEQERNIQMKALDKTLAYFA